ncbi:TPA: helix-turn-helix domain-containing protein [Streptococcus pneumoniae]
MRWDYYKIFKKIREDKHLSQTQVAGKMVSRQSVAAVESNKATPKFENMEYLLRQMDMTFAEFQYICDYYQPNERMNIMMKLQELTTLMTREQIENLVIQCRSYLKTCDDIPIFRRMQLLQLYLQDDKEVNNQLLVEQIWKELQSYEEWYLGDLTLLVGILPYVSMESVLTLTDQILATLKRYESYVNIKEARFTILSNLAVTFLYNDYREKSLELIKLALKTAQLTHRSDYLGFCWVYKGILQKDYRLVDKGLLQKDYRLVDKGLLLLEMTDERVSYKKCCQEIIRFFPEVLKEENFMRKNNLLK